MINDVRFAVLLREVEEDDWQFARSIHFAPDENYPEPYQRTEEECRQYTKQFLHWQLQNPRQQYRFIVVLKTNQQSIGWCDLYSQGSSEAEMGYRIDARCWNRGYATQTAQLLLKFAFSSLNLSYVWSETTPENLASIRVMQKVGMQRYEPQDQTQGKVYYRLERDQFQ